MKTSNGEYVLCIFTGKICYTEREAGLVINTVKKHHYVGNRNGLNLFTVIQKMFHVVSISAKTAAFIT